MALLYDKLILDMSNIFYRVAAFNLKDLTEDKVNSFIKNNSIFEYYKICVQKFVQSTMGEVCLLFDPLLSNGQISERLKIKEGYKSNRDKNSPVARLRIDVLEKLYTYYVLEKPSRVSVYHDLAYEADDYVEKLTETGKCLMITSDEDFCRYLEEGRVEMLKEGLSITDANIFTQKDFEKKYGFKPNIVSVTFWKVMYGDKSDNVVGAFLDENTKVLQIASDYMKDLIKKFGEGNYSLKELKRNLFLGQNDFEKLKEYLLLSNTSSSYEKLLDLIETNFSVIESRLPRDEDFDINKFKIEFDLKLNDAVKKQKFTLGKVRSK